MKVTRITEPDSWRVTNEENYLGGNIEIFRMYLDPVNMITQFSYLSSTLSNPPETTYPGKIWLWY